MVRCINEVEKKGLKNRFAKCTCIFPDLNGLMVKGLRMGINVACISTMYCKGKKLGQEMRLQNLIGMWQALETNVFNLWISGFERLYFATKMLVNKVKTKPEGSNFPDLKRFVSTYKKKCLSGSNITKPPLLRPQGPISDIFVNIFWELAVLKYQFF